MMPNKKSDPDPASDPEPSSPISSLTISIDCADSAWKTILPSIRTDMEQAIADAINAVRPGHKAFEVSLRLTSDDDIQKLNTEYRQKNKPTNVLSFPQIDYFSDVLEMPEPILLGDIVMAWETLNREAVEQEKPLRDHVLHMLVHGTLHLLGFDHQTDVEAEEMENIERTVLKQMGIKDPY